MVEQSSETANTGIVYVLSNPAMPNYIKIGITSGTLSNDVQRRMRELNGTGVPRPFDCEYAAVVANPIQVEKALHVAFGDFRVSPKKEFFEGLAPFRVKAVLRLLETENATPEVTVEGENDDEEKPPKKEKFRFSMVGIVPGELLQWADNPEIECQVVNDKTRVTYEGQEWAISTLAGHLKGWKYSPSGVWYWLYNGETLQERRDRLEGDDIGE